MAANEKVLIEFTASYANVFVPQKNDLNGKDEFSVQCLNIPEPMVQQLKALGFKACVEKWGVDPAKWPQGLRTGLRKAEEKMKDGKLPAGMIPGSTWVTIKSTKKPGVVDQNVQDIIEPRAFYSGVKARAKVSAFAYDQKGNRGVSWWFENIQKVADGEPLGSTGIPASSEFEAVAVDPNSAFSGGGAASAFDTKAAAPAANPFG